ncbi:unnamed protein product [Effrenium voratum]|nr:unnamed protein product [Effrenium voratum]
MPNFPIDGGAELCVTPSGGVGKQPLSLNFQCRHVRRMLSINSGGFAGRLHWAVMAPDGSWQAPKVQPDGSQDCDGVASSAHLNGDGNVTMTFRGGEVPEKITLVVVIEVQGQTHWLKGPGGENFVIEVAQLAAEVGGGALGGDTRVAERVAKWPELEAAKAAVAASSSPDGIAASPTQRRRKTSDASPVANGSDIFVKAGEMQAEQGMGSLKWTTTSSKDQVSVFIEAFLELTEDASVQLHWGAAKAAGAEWQPVGALPPNSKAFDDIAARTPFVGQARLAMSFRHAQAPRWLSFVVYIKIGSGEMWLKREGGDNFWLPVMASPDECPQPTASGGEVSGGDKFCQAETRYQHFTQFQRLCICSDALAAGVDFESAAWVTTVLCLADAKALEWYRKSGYQPKDMAHAQERIGGVISSAVANAVEPRVRTLLRLAVKAVPRGSSGGGDAIRHGILNIMRNHGIKEGHRPGIECKFIEQWHQKLHTNSAPDDIAICEGYLAFLQSGNVDDMWRVMWEVGKLTHEDLGKMCQMGFKDHTKSGGRGLNFTPVHLPHMYNDVKGFLGLLRHVHGGTDLFALCEACKGQYPDHESECLAFTIFHSRDDPFSLGKILDLRRRLESLTWKRDVLMLDVAMEEQLRMLAERSNVGDMQRDDLLTFIFLILEDLMLSRHDPSMQQGYALLQKLQGLPGKWEPEWCKMLHAACDRLALTCTATADAVSTALQECADKLLEAGSRPGAVFSPEQKHLGSFGEEKARCLTERVLAQTLKVFMPQLRRPDSSILLEEAEVGSMESYQARSRSEPAASRPDALPELAEVARSEARGRFHYTQNPFAQHMQALQEPSWPKVTHASAARYNGCHQTSPVFWLYLWGHLRSWHLHLANLRSFLAQSNPCWHVVIYTREELTHQSRAKDAKVMDQWQHQGLTVLKLLQESSLENLAWAVTERSKGKEDYHAAVVQLGLQVARLQGIPQTPDDIIAFSRPDVLFSHAIDVHRIRQVMSWRKHVLLPHHEATSIGGNDPSELFVVGPRQFFEEPCLTPELPCGRRGWRGWYCGYYGAHFVYWAYSQKIAPFFFFTGIKFQLHRMSGSIREGVMRPLFQGLRTANSSVKGVVDLTRQARCVVGDPLVCNASQHGRARRKPPKSKCWGESQFVKVNSRENPKGSALWVCKNQLDVDHSKLCHL